MSKAGQNNRGYKDPELPRWGVRKFPDSRGRIVMVVAWHAKDAQPSKYVLASGLTKAQAEVIRRTLVQGKLGR